MPQAPLYAVKNSLLHADEIFVLLLKENVCVWGGGEAQGTAVFLEVQSNENCLSRRAWRVTLAAPLMERSSSRRNWDEEIGWKIGDGE